MSVIKKTLIIAEKPSVAKDLTLAIGGKFVDKKKYYEGDKYIVSFAIGHLVAICSPPEFDEKYKSWSLDYLPILPKQFLLKKVDRTRGQLSELSRLLKRRDVEEIINACDAGREGELIFRYILSFVYGDKPVNKILKRLWLQSMTKSSILEGLKHLRSDDVMQNLKSVAFSRSEADWLVGINTSRALTGWKSRFGGFFLTPCGRVQTPTLSMIVTREIERNDFKSQQYFEIQAKFILSNQQSYIGKWFDFKFKKQPDKPQLKPERLWTKKQVQEILEKCQGKSATVVEKTKPVIQNSPLLYDLTSLQREANAKLGLSAKATLSVAQSLYERHKVVTYPRTGSRYLPEDYLTTVKGTLKKIGANSYYSNFSKKILDNNWVKYNKRIFDNKKISDHFAIIPTGVLPKSIGDLELKIYQMIVQRFLAIFYPPAEYLNIRRISTVDQETFKTEGNIVQKLGWTEVYGKVTQKENILPPVKSADKVVVENIESTEKQTQPPARFNESTLLSMMESAGKLVEDEYQELMKETGIGTPATRAAIIEGLINDKYLIRQAKDLVPTAKGMELMETLTAMQLTELSSPQLTGEWEKKMEDISQGKVSRNEFMEGICDFTRSIVSKIKSFDSEKNREKSFILEGKQFYQSLNYYENEDKSIQVRRYLGGRLLTVDEIQILLKEKKIGPLTGFVSKKKGKPFSALLKLNSDQKVEFVFEQEAEDIPDFNSLNVVGVSPIDNTKVYETDISYVSASYFDEDNSKGLKIGKVILGQAISPSNMALMLQGKKSELIKNFRSKRTNRNFDAYLLLSNKGKMSFEFPARKRAFKKR